MVSEAICLTLTSLVDLVCSHTPPFATFATAFILSHFVCAYPNTSIQTKTPSRPSVLLRDSRQLDQERSCTITVASARDRDDETLSRWGMTRTVLFTKVASKSVELFDLGEQVRDDGRRDGRLGRCGDGGCETTQSCARKGGRQYS